MRSFRRPIEFVFGLPMDFLCQTSRSFCLRAEVVLYHWSGRGEMSRAERLLVRRKNEADGWSEMLVWFVLLEIERTAARCRRRSSLAGRTNNLYPSGLVLIFIGSSTGNVYSNKLNNRSAFLHRQTYSTTNTPPTNEHKSFQSKLWTEFELSDNIPRRVSLLVNNEDEQLEENFRQKKHRDKSSWKQNNSIDRCRRVDCRWWAQLPMNIDFRFVDDEEKRVVGGQAPFLRLVAHLSTVESPQRKTTENKVDQSKSKTYRHSDVSVGLRFVPADFNSVGIDLFQSCSTHLRRNKTLQSQFVRRVRINFTLTKLFVDSLLSNGRFHTDQIPSIRFEFIELKEKWPTSIIANLTMKFSIEEDFKRRHFIFGFFLDFPLNSNWKSFFDFHRFDCHWFRFEWADNFQRYREMFVNEIFITRHWYLKTNFSP